LKALGEAESVQLEVSDRKAVFAAAADIEKRHGRIDILVTSAGTNISGPNRNFKTMSAEGWDEVVAVNLNGLFYCCHAVLPGMRSRKDGLIINISSWAGRYASALTGPAYNATKRAVIAVTESINIEECRNGIRATSILPGEVATPILEKRPVPPAPQERARMTQPEDLGAAILFVAAMPARTCVNELIISPTWNRLVIGGLEAPK
ncbi:MAG TPA: SDR family oxidoreductase, partial [Burkholderiales bacterium]|nr:SDR family oxidoreductase [Burkholderiales bacterium]